MKILVLSPSDMTTEATIGGLQALRGHVVYVYRYDQNGIPVDHGLIAAAKLNAPDLIVYIGQNGGRFLASESTFIYLRSICPTVLLVFDGSDITWTKLLNDYGEHGAFDLVVNIDGNPDWPKRPRDITALTPVAQGFYA